jgi:hypothetical protein
VPEDERKDLKARRQFYQAQEDYDVFARFCDGDVSKHLPRAMALWMTVAPETRQAIEDIVAKGKPLQKGVDELGPALPEILLNEVLARYITALPQDKKLALLAGQPVSLPPGEGSKTKRGRG